MSGPISASPTLEPPPALTKTDLEERFATLPDWLNRQLVAYMQVRQVRWNPFQRRKHGFLWVVVLRTAWIWLLQERRIEGFSELRMVDLSAYMTHLHELGLSASTQNVYLSVLLSLLRYLEEHEWPVSPALFRVALRWIIRRSGLEVANVFLKKNESVPSSKLRTPKLPCQLGNRKVN